MMGFYILIILACVVCGLIVSGKFGNILYNKAEDIKDIYVKEDDEREKENETNEQER